MTTETMNLRTVSATFARDFAEMMTAWHMRRTMVRRELEVERRLRMEAVSRAEAMKRACEEAESRMRIEIELRIQAECRARNEAAARLKTGDTACEEAERRAEKMINSADFACTEGTTSSAGGIANGSADLRPAVAQALTEMMARVRAEQQEAMEKRARAAEDYAKNGTMELASRKRGVLYKVLRHSLSF
jgi:hypothetical protein